MRVYEPNCLPILDSGEWPNSNLGCCPECNWTGVADELPTLGALCAKHVYVELVWVRVYEVTENYVPMDIVYDDDGEEIEVPASRHPVRRLVAAIPTRDESKVDEIFSSMIQIFNLEQFGDQFEIRVERTRGASTVETRW